MNLLLIKKLLKHVFIGLSNNVEDKNVGEGRSLKSDPNIGVNSAWLQRSVSACTRPAVLR